MESHDREWCEDGTYIPRCERCTGMDFNTLIRSMKIYIEA